MKRVSSLLLAGVVGLSACSDQPTSPMGAAAPIAPDAPSFSLGDAVASDAGSYLVRFKGNGVPADFASQVAALGGEVIFAHAGAGVAAVAGLSADAAGALAGSSSIAAVDADASIELEPLAGDPALMEGDQLQSPSNPTTAAFYGRQWNMGAIGGPQAWAAGKLGSPSVKVGILDTGIDYLHPDLVGRVDLKLSRSFLSATENARVPAGAHPVADLNYHGTHVAATVASNGLLAAGVSSQVTLVGLKVCTPGTPANGYRGSCPTSGTLAAVLYAADQGLDVINMSLGGSFDRRQASAAGGNGPSFLATINQVMTYAHRKGTTVVVSAGNSALDIDHDGNGYKSYCSSPTVVCVSATGPTSARLVATPAFPRLGEYVDIQNIDALASYSNFGRSAISVAAPGGNGVPVWAACSGFTIHPALAGCRTRTATSGSVVGISGTSMAAPHVAGLAALVAGELGRNPARIQARLQQSADDLGQSGVDPAYGKGRINVAKAMGL